MATFKELKIILDQKAEEYNNPRFIESDPIQIPQQFSKKEDVEISGFLISTFAWGNRKSIINNGTKLLEIMNHQPHQYILNYKEENFDEIKHFVHRTFQPIDLHFFLLRLKEIYTKYGSLEYFFITDEPRLQNAISDFKKWFFDTDHLSRTTKHIADPQKGSSAKRINMFLRWMVRKDKNGVDFGIWHKVQPHQLSLPLDVHTGNVARKLGLIERKQNDAKTVEELDHILRKMDAEDPVKYDFALFGMGVFEKIK